MRYCRFMLQGVAQYGVVETVGGVEHITQLLGGAPEAHGTLKTAPTKRMEALRLLDATMLAPVQPSKIIGVGRNYRAHAAELNNEVPKEPLIFFKPPSSVIATGEKILRPRTTQNLHYEGELGVVIGRKCFKLNADEDVKPYILGYTALNDVTARDLQKTDGQWTRAKGYDTFCPVGPLVTDEIDPWAGVDVGTKVNGVVKQNGNTRDFVFALDVVIRYIADSMTLMPGDLICTGTPEGVGAMVSGDVVEVTVAGVGTIRNMVVDAA